MKKSLIIALLALGSLPSFAMAEDAISIECKNEQGRFSYSSSTLAPVRGTGPNFALYDDIGGKVIDTVNYLSMNRGKTISATGDAKNKNLVTARIEGEGFTLDIGTAYVEGYVLGAGFQFSSLNESSSTEELKLIKQDQDSNAGKVLLASAILQKNRINKQGKVEKTAPQIITLSFKEDKDCAIQQIKLSPIEN